MRSETIEKNLKKVQRLRLLRLVLQISLLGITAILFSILGRQVAETFLFYHPIILLLAVGGVLLFVAILSTRIYFHENAQTIAHELDGSYKLKDRLSTYIELRDSNHSFLPALTSESEKHFPKLSLLGSARLQKGSLLPLILTSIVALSLATFPLWPVPQDVAARAEQHRQIARHSKQLIKEIEKIRKSKDTAPEIKKLADEFQKMANRVNKPDTDPAQALQKMNEMQKQLKDLQAALEKGRRDRFSKNLNANKGLTPKEGTENQEQDLQREAQELQEALEREGLKGGEEIQQKLKSGNLTSEDLKKMQKALENYRTDKKSKEQQLSELQKSLENARKGMTSGKSSVTYDSQLKDRDVDTSKGGVNDGPGTTNKDVGPHHFDTKKKGKSEYSEDRTKAEYEQMYSGQRENVGKDPLFLGSKWDAEKSRYVRVRTFGQDNEPEILPNQTDMGPQTEAETVVGKEKIPAAYRDLIRRYFQSIEK